jgi:hypothetical protein
MSLFRRSRLPSPPPAAGDRPPRPPEGRQQTPSLRPRGAWVSEGPRDPEFDPGWDPCTGSGPVAVGGKSNGGRA